VANKRKLERQWQWCRREKNERHGEKAEKLKMQED
jgi:hypothetical protein